MDLRQLQQFAMLSETLSFRRAAERLEMAQPALSVSLQRLEAELGAQLFDRGRHGVTQTNAGRVALPEALRTLSHASRIGEQARAGARGLVGRARLGFVGTAAYDVLPKALIAFRNKYPSIEIELHERTTADLLVALEQQILEIGIVRYPTSVPSGLVLEKIEIDTMGVALPAGHPLARADVVAPSDLADELFVFPSMTLTPSLYNNSMARCQLAGFSPKIVQQASQIQTIIGLVQGGVGVAFIPALIARNAWQRIAFRPLSGDNPHLQTGLAILHDPKTISPQAQRLRDVILELAQSELEVPRQS